MPPRSIFVLQRKHMDGRVGDQFSLTPEQLGVLNPVFVLIFVPIMDKLLFPFFRTVLRVEPTALRRMGCGMLLTVVAFGLTAWTQRLVDEAPPDGPQPSALYQVPALAILTFAEVLVSATGLEWSYSQAPANMKATLLAIFYLMM